MEHSITKYFALPELFSAKVVAKYGEQAWSFLDHRLLDVLVWLREGLNVGLVCNTKTMQQRGFRENTCDMVANYTKQGHIYCSSHVLGKGVDLSSPKMSAEQMRQWVRKNIDTCPWPIRIEHGDSAPTWLHIDVCNISDNKLQIFKV